MEADLPKKLGLKEGQRVYLLNSPERFATELVQASPVLTLSTSLGTDLADVIIAWPENDLDHMFRDLLQVLKQAGAIWIVIPKKATGPTGPSFQSVLNAALPLGLIDNKSLSLSESEYCIRFMIKRRLRRPSEPDAEPN